MKYVNQLNYTHIPYPTKLSLKDIPEEKKKTTVRSSGCGLCSACMAVDILTDKTLEIEDCVHISEDCLANLEAGTNMTILGPVIAEKYNLTYKNTDDMNEAIEHLRAGGVIIVHVGIPEGATTGLFTRKGHYMLLVSTDGKEFCFLDPSYSPEKYKFPERIGKVNEANAPYLYVDVHTLHSETRIGKPKYHLFARKKG